MDERQATKALACSIRNQLLKRAPGLDPDMVYYAVHEALVEDWDAFIEAASLAFVQQEIYLSLKSKFEPQA